MSDIVKRLREGCGCNYPETTCMAESECRDAFEAADTITRLTAEVERRDAALRECEAELNAYYRMEYPSDHPYSQKKLAQAMASNPATVALKEKP
jgi:hypothetical protein